MAEWFVSSAVLAALLIGAHYLLRGKISARLQYALWLVLLVRLLLPLSVGKTALSVANLLPEEALPLINDSLVMSFFIHCFDNIFFSDITR